MHVGLVIKYLGYLGKKCGFQDYKLELLSLPPPCFMFSSLPVSTHRLADLYAAFANLTSQGVMDNVAMAEPTERGHQTYIGCEGLNYFHLGQLILHRINYEYHRLTWSGWFSSLCGHQGCILTSHHLSSASMLPPCCGCTALQFFALLFGLFFTLIVSLLLDKLDNFLLSEHSVLFLTLWCRQSKPYKGSVEFWTFRSQFNA